MLLAARAAPCLLAWSALACAAPVHLAAPSEAPASLREPGPDRVPLVVESAGAAQRVIVSSVELCSTPCTLYVRPGSFSFRTEGPELVPAHETVDVPPTGMRLRMRAPSARLMKAGAVVSGTAGLGGLLAIVVTTGAAYFAKDTGGQLTPAGQALFIGGFTAAALGAAAEVVGLSILLSNQPGVASRVTFKAAPAQSGGIATGTLTF